jgi:hypothetical protein
MPQYRRRPHGRPHPRPAPAPATGPATGPATPTGGLPVPATGPAPTGGRPLLPMATGTATPQDSAPQACLTV